jgi:hypothetical protein
MRSAWETVAAGSWKVKKEEGLALQTAIEAAFDKVRGLLQAMEAGNWEGKRAEALTLLTKAVDAPANRQN